MHHNLICPASIFFVSFRLIKAYNSIWGRSTLGSSSLTSVACLKRSICWTLNLRMCKFGLSICASFVAHLSCFTLFSKKNVIRSLHDYDRGYDPFPSDCVNAWYWNVNKVLSSCNNKNFSVHCNIIIFEKVQRHEQRCLLWSSKFFRLWWRSFATIEQSFAILRTLITYFLLCQFLSRMRRAVKKNYETSKFEHIFLYADVSLYI